MEFYFPLRRKTEKAQAQCQGRPFRFFVRGDVEETKLSWQFVLTDALPHAFEKKKNGVGAPNAPLSRFFGRH
jgi:hypothetical protein